MTPAKVLVSACLPGRPVRYNGSAKTLEDALLDRWISEGRVVSVCPEVVAGSPTPRPPAEIANGASGAAVIERDGRIVEADGTDVTAAYLAGARIVLEHAARHDCRYALLTDGSPSCGGSFLYDGSFQGRRIDGEGVTAALLRQHGSPEGGTGGGRERHLKQCPRDDTRNRGLRSPRQWRRPTVGLANDGFHKL